MYASGRRVAWLRAQARRRTAARLLATARLCCPCLMMTILQCSRALWATPRFVGAVLCTYRCCVMPCLTHNACLLRRRTSFGLNDHGQLGTGSSSPQGASASLPNPVAPFAGVTLRHVAAGLRHVVAVSGTLSTAVARANTQHGLPLLTRLVLLAWSAVPGRVFSWGCGSDHQLGTYICRSDGVPDAPQPNSL